jgi:hypothetical protein
MTRLSLLAVPLVLSFGVANARACSVGGRPSAVGMVREADVILRATPEYSVHAGSNPNSTDPDSRIQFKVLEVVRGEKPDRLVLSGALVETDDFNDLPSPYDFVRPDGRRGSCFASSYRLGGQYLLMLKRNRDRELTIYWYPLAPVNEQLHSASDPWLLWVRQEAQKPGNQATNSR